MVDGELLCTKILEVNLFAIAYRLFHENYFMGIPLHQSERFFILAEHATICMFPFICNDM